MTVDQEVHKEGSILKIVKVGIIVVSINEISPSSGVRSEATNEFQGEICSVQGVLSAAIFQICHITYRLLSRHLKSSKLPAKFPACA